MSSSIRGCAAALVLALVCFPALTRTVQVLDTGHHPGQTSGFHKSVDIPPSPPVVSPDPTVHPVVVDTATPSFDRWLRAADDRLPADPIVSDARSLRAPPARLL